MSQEEKKASQVILERLDKLETSLKMLMSEGEKKVETPPKLETPSFSITDNHLAHVKACPECYEKALKLVGLPVDMECGKCGARLSTRQNLNACPFCGETKRASRI